ncbi:hypothetical protein CC86DRAFT_59806 [Ophiobolus disseminans]|uniref:Uncharacterized protein n=1 Tax=Ophiobolus disseminans TaxID=1469910 RepID=A0A6A6ZRR6_9PLEO|nr:hypothetical protein CC86DRAFT_59806 [Ophiobolus disseminans]
MYMPCPATVVASMSAPVFMLMCLAHGRVGVVAVGFGGVATHVDECGRVWVLICALKVEFGSCVCCGVCMCGVLFPRVDVTI